ncbi:DUF3800 domain-containing protein [Caulobacter segnis]|uniref:DUF3800 domain-containing protein n=1 Tax=Caulobacter segnis TaxID=88688 RepID=UPI002863ABA5|nr:DUF3800 domain-containing protein [Caulobacter segnis]MDR6624371.1 hypothetical protein [Caulobacter segnis]
MSAEAESPPLPPVYHLYLDDSGSRHLDKLAKTANQHPTWFALGGFVVRADDEDTCRTAYDAFCQSWPQMSPPLHLTDMRARRKNFNWLEKLSTSERERFWQDYHAFLTSLPVIGTACVVHRPGYLARGYGSRPGDSKWDLCRTAFNIVVERTAKFVASKGARLRVKFEGCDIKSDQLTKGYFALLKAGNGLQFDAERSAKYAPMEEAELVKTLIDLERKDKRSKLMQIADTYVYAIARGRYEADFPMFAAINSAGKLIDSQVGTDAAVLGVKYSCFDGI